MAGLTDRLAPDAQDFFDTADYLSSPDQLPATAGEAFQASFEITDTSNTDWKILREFQDARERNVAELTGVAPDVLMARRLAPPDVIDRVNHALDSMQYTTDAAGNIQTDDPVTNTYLRGVPNLSAALLAERQARQVDSTRVGTDDDLLKASALEYRMRRRQAEKVLSRAEGVGAAVASFAGASAKALTDPLVVATLPLGYGEIRGLGIAGNAWRAFWSEAAIAGLTEIPIQARVAQYREQFGVPLSSTEAAWNILTAAAGAGGVRAVGSVTLDLLGAAVKRYRGEVTAGRVVPTQETEAAARAAERTIRDDLTRPGDVSLPFHQNAIAKAISDINDGRAVDVSAFTDGPTFVGRATTPTEWVQNQIAELIPEAADYLTRGDRKVLEGRLRNLEYDRAALQDELPTVAAMARQIEPELPTTLSPKARQGKALKLARERLTDRTEVLDRAIASVKDQLARHDRARQPRKVLDKIEQARAKGASEADIASLIERETGNQVPVSPEPKKTAAQPSGSAKASQPAGGVKETQPGKAEPVSTAPAKAAEPPELARAEPEDMGAALADAMARLESADLSLPLGETLADGERVLQSRSAREVLTEIKSFRDALDALDTCRKRL